MERKKVKTFDELPEEAKVGYIKAITEEPGSPEEDADFKLLLVDVWNQAVELEEEFYLKLQRTDEE